MQQPVPTIAVLSASPALASILGATLRYRDKWRVREFEDSRVLHAYMRIAPIAMLVADYDLGINTAADIVTSLRADQTIVSRDIQVIAMSRRIDDTLRRRCVEAGIDEVVAKPMSPLYLKERIGARLKQGASAYVSALPHYVGPDRRDRIALRDLRPMPFERRGDNVVSFLEHKALRDTPVNHEPKPGA